MIFFQKELVLEKEVCFKSYDELFESKIKFAGVFITTPSDSHAEDSMKGYLYF